MVYGDPDTIMVNGRLKFTFMHKMIDWYANMPIRSEDGLPHTDDYYCAFESKEQLLQYNNKDWFKELRRRGFRIYEIIVKDAKFSSSQAVYLKRNVIRKRDITQQFI